MISLEHLKFVDLWLEMLTWGGGGPGFPFTGEKRIDPVLNGLTGKRANRLNPLDCSSFFPSVPGGESLGRDSDKVSCDNYLI